ncbi:MAG: hypothetical protein ACRD3V_21255 [Vicinamibacteria bacterium]
MKAAATGYRLTLFLAALTLLVIALSLPSSLREAFERGGLYLFSREFLEHIPRRLTGPGRFRFLIQPTIASVLGVAAGRSDAAAGKPPYLYALFFHGKDRGELLRGSVESIANLILMGILLDSVCQWLILGVSYPGAALVVGPVLIAVPYAVARSLSNRFAQARR